DVTGANYRPIGKSMRRGRPEKLSSPVGQRAQLFTRRPTLMSQVAMITGASRGIGAATARVLAERGFRVVVNYRSSSEEAEEGVAAITAAGGDAVAVRADVTDADDVAAMASETEQRWGRID